MNLEYGILWIDDNKNDEEIKDIKEKIRELGFTAKINFIQNPNSEEIAQLSKEDKVYHEIDLILLDYKLGDEKTGDEIAIKLRDMFPNTTILFYSSVFRHEDKLRHLIAQKKVDGVYCCTRINFKNKVMGLIEQTTASLNKLSGMRGLAMKVVADCDALMKESILLLTQKIATTDDAIEYLDNAVNKAVDSCKEKYRKCKNLESKLESRAIDSYKIFRCFRHLLKNSNEEIRKKIQKKCDLEDEEMQNEFLKFYTKLKEYYFEVLKIRNELGHAREKKYNGRLMLENKDKTIDISDNSYFVEKRKNFADQVEAVEGLKMLIEKICKDDIN